MTTVYTCILQGLHKIFTSPSRMWLIERFISETIVFLAMEQQSRMTPSNHSSDTIAVIANLIEVRFLLNY